MTPIGVERRMSYGSRVALWIGAIAVMVGVALGTFSVPVHYKEGTAEQTFNCGSAFSHPTQTTVEYSVQPAGAYPGVTQVYRATPDECYPKMHTRVALVWWIISIGAVGGIGGSLLLRQREYA